jgi:iron complex outermembrane recepter protein
MEKLMIRYVLNTLGSFRSALAVGVGLPFLVAASAQAQAPAPEATTERVIVTGSYIPTAETESALPVTVYTAEVLQKQGANSPVEGLRQLPSFVGNAATENDSNGGDGTATINLRALGSENTLVLVNGRRMFNQLGISSDINLIPIGGLSRTEVLKDGASAIYGSDAVAGVVNFVMIDGPGEKPYEGAELYALYGNTTDSDAHVRQVYLRGGVTGLDGKVSIAAVGEYYSRANLFSRDRIISRTGDASNNPQGLGLGGVNSNSPTYAGRISVAPGATALGFLAGGQLVLDDLGISQVTPGDYRRFEPLPNANPPGGTLPGDFQPGTDPSRFNFRAFTPAIPAMEKAMYYITGRYKIFGDGLQLYGDIMYSKVKQDNGLAGAPFTISSTTGISRGITESRLSPFNPAGNFLTSVRYRLQQDLGDRRSFFDKDYYRYTAGINGDFNFKDNGFISHFGYDSGYVYERFDEQEIDSGDATRSGIIAGISGLDTDGDGVPDTFFNPFIGQNAPLIGNAPTYINGVPTGLTAPYNNVVTAQAASYVGHSFFLERDQLYDAKVNMHLFPNLWNGGVDLAVGYEHREVNAKVIADPVQRVGDQLGFNQGSDLKNRQEVDSVFTELIVPIVTSTMNVPFVRSLELSLAWRYEKFDDTDLFATDPTMRTASFDNVNDDENFGGTPRVSLRYQPIADVTLRASWGQSFRSPLPGELFLPIIQDFPVLFDPVTQTTGQPPGGVFRGGNTTLLPEKTDSYSAGVVWTPKFLPGFTMTLDWYQLFTTDLILSGNDFAQVLLTGEVVAPNNTLNDCGTPNDIGIIRNPDGTLFCINSQTGNAGKRNVQGMDMTAVYEIPTERFGKFTFSGGWNHFFTWKAQPGVGAFTNFLGNYNNGTLPLAPGAIPWNKGFLRGEWQWRNFDFVATGNYVGDFRDDPAFFVDFVGVRTVPSYITLDMQLSYEFVKPAAEPLPTVKDSKDSKNVMQTAAETSSIWQRILWGTKLTVGVNDAFDRQPPSVLGAFNDNYDTSLYSIRNRYWYASLSKKF